MLLWATSTKVCFWEYTDMVNIREIAFLFFKQNEGWWMKLRYYFTNYFFLCMVRFKCAIAVSKINNRTIIITSLRALLLLQMKNWSTSFPFFPLFWNSRIVSWWNVTSNFPLGVWSLFKQFWVYFLPQ